MPCGFYPLERLKDTCRFNPCHGGATTTRKYSMDDKTKKMIQHLEEEGAVFWHGMNEDGEAVFKFNIERLKEVMPEMYDSVMEDIDNDLMLLYKQELVEIEYDEELNARFKLTEKGKEWAAKLKNGQNPFVD